MTELSGRATVLVNPSAGGGTGHTSEQDVLATLRSLGFSPESVHTRSAEHAVEVAAQASPDDLLLPLGGDGMISFVAAGCVQSGARMTPLPAGRGNDFVRGLGLPRNTLAVTRALAGGTERLVDVATADGRVFVGTAVVGYYALSNARANRMRRLKSGLVYTAAGVQTALTTKPMTFTVRSSGGDGDREETFEGWSVAVGNSGRHGGGLTATPGADLADGLLDVLVVTGRGLHRLAPAALLERGGNQVRLPHVHTWRAETVHITAVDHNGEPLEVYADGDPVTVAPTDIAVKTGALRLFY